MGTSSDRPPRDRVTRGKRAKSDKLVESLTGLYTLIGTIITPLNLADGLLIINAAEERAREVVAVAELHPKMFAFLENLIHASVYGALIAGHVGMLSAILANHGRVPAFLKQQQQDKKQASPSGQEWPPMGIVSLEDMQFMGNAMTAMMGALGMNGAEHVTVPAND